LLSVTPAILSPVICRQITGDKIAGVTGFFRGFSRAGGPSQQITKTDGLSYRLPPKR
jgi:hypothetical protein